MLVTAGIAVPDTLTYVAVDFERETLSGALDAAGFAATQRSFFSWLGVVPYLTEAAIFSTLGYIAKLPGGGEVVFDYVNPAASVAAAGRAAKQALAARVAAAGERFQSSAAKSSAPAADVAPSIKKSRVYETVARKPPAAGPTGSTTGPSSTRASAGSRPTSRSAAGPRGPC